MRSLCGLQSLPTPVALFLGPHMTIRTLPNVGCSFVLNGRFRLSNELVASRGPKRRSRQVPCRARRRIIEDDNEEDEYLGNLEVAKMEAYTADSRSEVLLVHALVDGQEDQVIIFKGYSASLMRKTSSNPSKPVLPSRAIIKSIDRIRGPFNPSKVEYIEKDLSWEEFQKVLEGKQL